MLFGWSDGDFSGGKYPDEDDSNSDVLVLVNDGTVETIGLCWNDDDDDDDGSILCSYCDGKVNALTFTGTVDWHINCKTTNSTMAEAHVAENEKRAL